MALLILALADAAASGAGCAPARRPGPNDAYHDPRVSAEVWNHFFEDDGRGEIYRQRRAILDGAAVKPGMRVADVGAGTGLFSMMLSDAVGPGGVVYAEEVVDRFSRYIAERAERERRVNVVSVLGTEGSVGLAPARSILPSFATFSITSTTTARCWPRSGARCARAASCSSWTSSASQE